MLTNIHARARISGADMKRAILILAVLLAGCGGGDWEDDGAGLQPVDCKAKPEACR